MTTDVEGRPPTGDGRRRRESRGTLGTVWMSRHVGRGAGGRDCATGDTRRTAPVADRTVSRSGPRETREPLPISIRAGSERVGSDRSKRLRWKSRPWSTRYTRLIYGAPGVPVS